MSLSVLCVSESVCVCLCAGPILESKGMHAIFPKKGKKGGKWAKYFENFLKKGR